MSELFRIAQLWFNGAFNESMAKKTADVQGIDFAGIEFEYGRLYEESERWGVGKWN